MLGAGTAVVGSVAACGTDAAPARSATATTPSASAASPDADVAVLTSALSAEAALLRLCEATGRRHPELDPVVTRIITTQRAHVRRMTESLATPPTNPPSPAAKVPRTRTSAVRMLTTAFAAAEQDRLSDCLTSTSGLLARLLASVSASHAVTVEAVRAAR